MLFLPDVTKAPGRPVGPTKVMLPDGDEWEFKFVKVACNIARPVGSDSNDLPALLRRWFGKNAGVPGTDFRVRFEKTVEQWRIIPVGFDSPPQSANPATLAPIESLTNELTIEANVAIAKQYRTHAPVYDLVAAAGDWGDQGIPEPIGWTPIKNRTLSKGMFVAQVVGHSMEPKIPSGSWCLFKPAPTGSRNNKLLLVQLHTHIDPEAGGRYTVKRYHSTKQLADDGWQHESVELQPLNSEFVPIQLSPENSSDIRVIGEFDSVIS